MIFMFHMFHESNTLVRVRRLRGKRESNRVDYMTILHVYKGMRSVLRFLDIIIIIIIR